MTRRLRDFYIRDLLAPEIPPEQRSAPDAVSKHWAFAEQSEKLAKPLTLTVMECVYQRLLFSDEDTNQRQPAHYLALLKGQMDRLFQVYRGTSGDELGDSAIELAALALRLVQSLGVVEGRAASVTVRLATGNAASLPPAGVASAVARLLNYERPAGVVRQGDTYLLHSNSLGLIQMFWSFGLAHMAFSEKDVQDVIHDINVAIDEHEQKEVAEDAGGEQTQEPTV